MTTTASDEKRQNATYEQQSIEMQPEQELISPESDSVVYPPQDGGLKAWLFLFGACIVEITAWGTPIAGAFTTSGAGLVICLGIIYGLGAGLLFAPSMHFMGDWFVKRKSFAYGVICGAGAAAGAGLPPVYTLCLNKYGYKATLIGWGICTFVITSFGLLFVHSRTPPEKAPKPSRSDFDFIRRPLFLVFLAATLAQALGYYAPSNYLPSIGADFGLTDQQGALLNSLINLAQAIGQPVQGFLADTKASFYLPMLISTLGGGLESLLIWPFASKLWSLVIFSLAYGATAGGFAVLRPRFAQAVVGDNGGNKAASGASAPDGESEQGPVPPQDAAEEKESEVRDRNKSMFIFGIFTAVRGIAILSSGFITVGLVHQESEDLDGYGHGYKWRSLIIYTGVTQIVSALGTVAKFIGR
ncbi:hypothetical protein Daus18300_011414 [Diaporthe australafricana]|uniref:MFS general substrate transporter n=1 Tax=Diaporthe australafricana TaxID=127596 RepID=A0ABR3W6M5_9PEZI